MNGQNTRMKSSGGLTTSSAVASARSSAIHFGASSPKTISTAVMIGEGDRDRDAVCGRGGEVGRQERQLRLDERGQRRLGEPAEPEAGHGDAELCRGDVAIGRRDGAPHGARAAVALGDQLIDARLAHRDDRELRGDEKAVGHDQRQQRREPPQAWPRATVPC